MELLLLFYPGWMRLMFTWMGACAIRLLPQSHYSTQTFRRALTASVDSCAEIKECPFSGGVRNQSWQSSEEEGAGKRCWEWAED